MLSIAPASMCDVCLDSFGPGDKTPCSIQCGHVFCEACLNNINRGSCPLCRTHFDQRAIVKLHVDLDGSSSDSLSSGASARQEARRLQMAIASIANEGTTEPRLRQLIAEATAFLATQPRELFSELRISHRMIAYLCDIKAKFRSQKSELEKLSVEASQLKDENGELQQQIDKLNRVRKDEKETALAVEMSLRDHCARAHATYAQLADRHAHVMKQWSALTAKIGGLHLSEPHILNAQSDAQSEDIRFLTSDIASPFNPHEAGNSNPDSILISPLPQFTSVLPRSFTDLCPLPDVGSDPTFTSLDRPVTCPDEIPPFPEMPSFAISSPSRSPLFIERVPDSASERNNDLSYTTTPPYPGGHGILNYSRSSSLSRQSSHSRSPSQLGSRSSSPPAPVSSVQAHSRIPSPLDQGPSTSVVPPAPVISRLHELMETPLLSSSLPNMSNHFPSSVTRDSHRSRGIHSSRSPSRSRSASLRLPQPIAQPTRKIYSDAVSSTEHASITVKPPSSFGTTSGPVSSASTAAMALEKAQREQRARRIAEREQEKLQESEKLEKRQEKSERDRPRVDIERVRGHQTTASTSHPFSHWEPIKVYSNMPVSSDYSSHRSHGSRPGSSAPRDSYQAHKHTATKAIPILPTTKV